MVNNLYTPILKWKGAEKAAIGGLSESQKDSILPLFEYIRPIEVSASAKNKGILTPEDELMTVLSESIPVDIFRVWGDGRSFISDFSLIFPEDLRINFAKAFSENADKLHLSPILGVNLADSSLYQNAIVSLNAEYKFKLCVRLKSIDIKDITATNKALEDLIANNNLSRKTISLLFDLEDNVSKDFYSNTIDNIQKITEISDYENVILAGGAFPKDMSQFKKDEANNNHARSDWISWSSHIHNKGVNRMPSFADYTIRHPIYNAVTMKFRSTATIKYALSDKWNIYKGTVGAFDNCLANASLLRTTADFYGSGFSAGDRYIDEKGLYFPKYMEEINKQTGKKVGGTGNAEQWICAGINHHIAVVVDQLANLDE